MRVLIFKYLLTGLLIFLLAGLFYTQIIQGNYYRDLGENNRIRLIPITAPRGRILDRAGRVLAGNRPSYNVYIMPRDFDPTLSGWLEGVLMLPEGYIKGKLGSKKYPSYLPLELKQDVTKEAVFQIEEKKPDLTGIYMTVEGRRFYPFGSETAHLTGYLGKVSENEYVTGEGKFTLNDIIGRAGIEKVFDDQLRGENGGRQVEVNSRGQAIRTIGERKPTPGKDVTLSVDLDVQRIIWDEVRDHPNSLSVGIMDVKSGEMIAIVSKPAYDPNIFVTGGSSAERLAVLKDKNYPILDRLISVGYPPGSIFKIVTSLAGLENKKINPNSSFTCTSTFRLGNAAHVFHCWNEYGHGTLPLHMAIVQSCNVYFYNLGRIVGENNLAKMSRIMGLASPPPIELPVVFEGLIPDDVWKKEMMREKWYAGETISYAIGQGYVLVSPLQILRMVATMANHGLMPKVTVLRDQPVSFDKVAVSAENLETVRNAMLDVVQSDRGTGKYARVPFMHIGAKTGTAQNPQGKSHAWFAGFFPFENPRYAMVTMIEHGGAGGLAAGTLTKEILVKWREEKGAQIV